MTYLVFLLICFSFLITAIFLGTARAMFVAILGTIFFMPFSLNSAEYGTHVGVAPYSLSLSTYALLVFATWVVSIFWGSGKQLVFITILPVIALGLGGVLLWVNESNIYSGIWNYSVGILAIPAGAFLWKRITNGVSGDLFVTRVLLLFLIVEFGIVLGQMVGANFPYYGDAGSAGSIIRPGGTFGHPGNLGKILVLSIMLLLPFTKTVDRRVRFPAVLSVVLCVIMIAISYSRANMVAALVLLGVWFALKGISHRKIVRNFLVFMGAWIVALPFIDTFLLRFQEDPDGGARPQLLAEAYGQVSKSFFIGVGPNNYVEVVGMFGSATAAGFPVHNAMLLLLAELGFIVLGIFLLPFIIVALKALSVMRLAGKGRWSSRSLVASFPAIALISHTGWGMLSNETWAYFGFVIGCLFAGISASSYSRSRFSVKRNVFNHARVSDMQYFTTGSARD